MKTILNALKGLMFGMLYVVVLILGLPFLLLMLLIDFMSPRPSEQWESDEYDTW